MNKPLTDCESKWIERLRQYMAHPRLTDWERVFISADYDDHSGAPR